MIAFTTGELTGMQTTQEAAMQDTCVVQTETNTPDDWNNPVVTYNDGDAISCGVRHVSPRELQESGEVAVYDAEVRLPIGTAVTSKNRIKVTKRYGVAITAEVFEVIGLEQRGPSGLVAKCVYAVNAP